VSNKRIIRPGLVALALTVALSGSGALAAPPVYRIDHVSDGDTVALRGFYFGSATKPFDYDSLTQRAYRAWEAAGLERITLHESRHTYRSYLDSIPAISETRADRYMGHSNKSMRSRYTHSLDGQLAKDAAALDEFLSGVESGKVVRLDERAA